jgi:transcriptional regulator with XRE-family HTH domain
MNSKTTNPVLRPKILGTQIRDARLHSGKTIAECAQALSLPAEEFEAYELGKNSPSLPELEYIAYYLGIPFDQFWSSQTYSEIVTSRSGTNSAKLIQLRHRIIGALIRQARESEGHSIDELGLRTSISVEDLRDIELGKKTVSVPQLELIASTLHRSIRDFQDHNSPIGKWIDQQQAIKDLTELPDDLQLFIRKPINKPYLELAQRLSEMPVDKLRSIAEGLLEITY